eukprot:scaffold81287_cov72-Phaeocystis_antarctica.AAC.7
MHAPRLRPLRSIQGGRALQSPVGLRVRRLGTLRRATALCAGGRCYGRGVRSLTLLRADCGDHWSHWRSLECCLVAPTGYAAWVDNVG